MAMSEVEPTRESMQARVVTQRERLHAVLRDRTSAQLAGVQITHEWNGLDILRHMVMWNDLTLRALQDWTGSRAWAPSEPDLDIVNANGVRERAELGVEELSAQLQRAYTLYLAMLGVASDEELSQPGLAPWNETITRLQAIGAVGHDAEHTEEIAAALR
jgi:hypothetical protein